MPWGGQRLLTDDADSDATPFTRDSDFIWAYATVPGELAYRGRMFRHLKSVVQNLQRTGETWTFDDVLGLTNQEMVAEGLTMMKQDTLQGRRFGGADLVSH